MDHNEAVQQLAVERYLLDEMPSELRDEFEEHMFDCADCALDLRAGAAFVQEAKLQLPELVASSKAQRATVPATAPVWAVPKSAPGRSAPARYESRARDWFAWLRPVFAVPAFAAMLAVIGYQNLATIPGLRTAATEPRLVPWTSFHTGTRGGARLEVPADRKFGAVVAIEVPQETLYAKYVFELYDQQGKQIWTQTVSGSSNGDGTFSLMIPGAELEQGAYTLVITGATPQGGQTEIDRHILDVHFDD
jgi:hypothetical protein